MNIDRIRDILILGFLAAISLGGYIFFSQTLYRVGFPLDDAWIHQVYARNLAEAGIWAFLPGKPSAGSTAPLWSGLVSIGYLLNLAPYIWTYFIGWLLLWGVGVTGYYGFRIFCAGQKKWALWVGVLLVVEWHLVWAAGSGMETLLFALIVLIVLLGVIQIDNLNSGVHANRFLLIGVLIGVSIWIRPDGITLLGPAIFVVLVSETLKSNRRITFVYLIVGFGIIFSSYLLFNQLLAGSFWPNTFYAKQEEYAVLRKIPIWIRFIDQLTLPLIGVGVLLLPGFIIFMIKSVKPRSDGEIAGWLWIIGFLAMYAIRLPVVYQHGRYVIPAMLPYYLFGIVGVFKVIELQSQDIVRRVISRVWALTIGIVLLSFWMIGARTYANDVAVIESEMVAVARWLAENTDQGDLIAVHDIGAIGYFGKREILDLAGLVSPEVIPIIRDEIALEEFLNHNQVKYLVTFPGWYPYLVGQSEMIYVTEGKYSPGLGGENMAVYLWKSKGN